MPLDTRLTGGSSLHPYWGLGIRKEGKYMQLGPTEQIEEMLIDNLKIVQDTRLYRFTSDSVLLSKFARAKAKDNVADFCAGSGIVAFHFYALNRALKGLSFTLFEMQEELSALSQKTIELNGFDCFTVKHMRVQDIPDEYNEKFSLVLCNPPYERGGFENDDIKKAICRKEITVRLDEIAAAAAKCLKFGGRLALVNRADRLAEVCYTLRAVNIEVKRVQFVRGAAGAKPYLLLVEGVKGGKPSTEILPDLINGK
jgi:tRNA1(Val) A37 N6-methylase TrmN6